METREKTQPGQTVLKPEFRPLIPQMRDSIFYFVVIEHPCFYYTTSISLRCSKSEGMNE